MFSYRLCDNDAWVSITCAFLKSIQPIEANVYIIKKKGERTASRTKTTKGRDVKVRMMKEFVHQAIGFVYL